MQSKGEIIAAYRDRPNAKRIQEIADKNEVTANEIRKILHDAGEDVAVFDTGKRPGRPKKDAEEPTEKKAEETLSNKTEKTDIKNDSLLVEIEPLEVPKAVIGLCHERIANINRQIQVYVEQVDLLNIERNELLEFLEGAVNEKEGVHGKV